MPQVTDERLLKMMDFLEYHRAHPDISFQDYHATRTIELSRTVLPRLRVYLDQRYWIFLRDAAMERPRKQVHCELLEILKTGVASGVLLCPLSDSAFFELLRQSDWHTRRATIRLIDDLSLGITIQNTRDRLRTEILDFFLKTTLEGRVPRPPVDRVWVKVGSVLGSAYPVFPGIPPEEQLAIQKAFLDFMWTLSLEEILTDTPLPDDSVDNDLQEAAARITQKSESHQHKMKSFRQVFLAEVGGFLDLHWTDLGDIFEAWYHWMHPHARAISQVEKDSISQSLSNVLYNIIRFRKSETSLPMVQIVAGLHAILRWNRTRAFQFTDFSDFYHAAAALPYCDVFLTEKFLSTMRTRPPLSFDKHFGVRVYCDEQTAIAALQE